MPTGPGDVLDLIRQGRATTRGDVLDVTGLSRMTVAQRIDALLAAGLIVEGDTDRGHRRPAAGAACCSTPTSPRVLAATVDTTHTRIAVTDLAGTVLREDGRRRRRSRTGPRRRSTGSPRRWPALLERSDVTPADLCGIGYQRARPGRPRLGSPEPAADHAGLGRLPGRRAPAGRVPGRARCITANDADAAALGEHAVGIPAHASLCLVKVSTGIGTGHRHRRPVLPRRRRWRRRHRPRPARRPSGRALPVRRTRLPGRRGERPRRGRASSPRLGIAAAVRARGARPARRRQRRRRAAHPGGRPPDRRGDGDGRVPAQPRGRADRRRARLRAAPRRASARPSTGCRCPGPPGT